MAHNAVVQEVKAASKPANPAPEPTPVEVSEVVVEVPAQPAPSPESLVGQAAQDVIALLGKPQGVFETGQGAIWMYSRWRVQFNDHKTVLSVEKDVSSASVGLAVQTRPAPTRTQPSAVQPNDEPPISEGRQTVTVISDGGQPVDLNALLSEEKVTIVDFYADWCGPCRALSPRLERLALEDPEVVLVKVDIVRWGTPVARQFSINSVPNVRVFTPGKTMVGKPTYEFSQVIKYVQEAKR